KWIPDSFYFLIGFMSFTSHQHDVFRLGKSTGCFYSFSPVADAQELPLMCCRQPCFHLIQDGIYLLTARVIRSQDGAIAMLTGYLSHDGPFLCIPVPATTDHRDQLLPPGAQ